MDDSQSVSSQTGRFVDLTVRRLRI